ncbi:hypothetical protein [Actinocatenispora sera]|nr:hypothetical protein [Actinocatenispora sera]
MNNRSADLLAMLQQRQVPLLELLVTLAALAGIQEHVAARRHPST